MKKKKIKNKNMDTLGDFLEFCLQNPEQRFWQALKNFTGVDKICVEKYNKELNDSIYEDTFYWKDKNK